MAAHATWKGYLKLSLVSCAIALYPAVSSSARVRFNTLNRKTGNRVKRLLIDAETEDTVENEDQVKGYEVGRGSYVAIEKEEIDEIKIESTHTVDISSFVPRAEVEQRYFDTPYFIVPDDTVAQEAFAVIRDAMREEGKAGLGRVVISGRERVMLIEPCGKGLIGTTLRYAYEVKDPKSYFEDIPDVELPKEMRELASHIIEKKADHFDPSKFEDHYEQAVIALVQSKQTGKPVQTETAAPPSNVVNLMEALRKSIGAEKAPAPKAVESRRGSGADKAPASKEENPKSSARPSKSAAPPAKKRNLKKAS